MSGVEVIDLFGQEGLPKAFEEVNNKLPLFEKTLELTKRYAEDAGVEPDESTVRGCQDRATELKWIFERISKSKSIMKRYSSIVIRQDKNHRVEDLMKNMLVDVQSLLNNQIFKADTQTQIQGLQTAIKELEQVEPSVPDNLFGSPASIIVYGDGPVHRGYGNMTFVTGDGVVNVAETIYNEFVYRKDPSDSD